MIDSSDALQDPLAIIRPSQVCIQDLNTALGVGILLDKVFAGSDAIDDNAKVLPFWQKKRDHMVAFLAIGAGQK